MDAQDFVTLQEAFDTGLIPKEFENIFPSMNCKWCGKPLKINGALTILRCDNSGCTIRLAKGLVKVLSNLGIKGIGDAKVLSHISSRAAEVEAVRMLFNKFAELGINPEDVLSKCQSGMRWQDAVGKDAYNEIISMSGKINMLGTSFEQTLDRVISGAGERAIHTSIDFLMDPPSEFKDDIHQALSVKRTFSEAVKVLAIPDMVERADMVFGDCDSYDEFLLKMEKYGGMSSFVQNKLVKSKNSKLGSTLCLRILTSAKDLKRIPEVFSITTSKVSQLDVVITGSITNVHDEDGGSYTKREFIQLLNDELAGSGVRLVLRGRVSRATRFLVCDTGGTSNLAEALYINEQREASGRTEPEIIISTSDEFLCAIMDMCGKTAEKK